MLGILMPSSSRNIVFIERYIFFALLMSSLYNASKKVFLVIMKGG